ncbi:MAG: hypothetical protein GWP45_10570, partial [Proteobacteria bacterium]|nr:hypothetical protein [Pseudomonadota bacterium]
MTSDIQASQETLEPSVHLADIEAALGLFAEGIAGRYLHIRSNQEFATNSRLKLNVAFTGQNNDTLFLPESLITDSPSAYRVLVMEQIGMRECDTLGFRMTKAVARLPQLAALYSPSADTGPRVGDYRLLFDSFSAPALAEDLFLLFEDTRIQSHLLRHYPGLAKHLTAHHAHLLNSQVPSDLIARAKRWRLGEPLSKADGSVERSLFSALQKHGD